MPNVANSITNKAANQSSDKLLQILECMAKERLPIRLQDLSVQVGISPPTVLRYLNSLQSANYIYQEEATSRYALTWKICRLSQNLNSNLGLRSITSPFMTELANKLNLGVCLVAEENFECVYLDCIDAALSYKHTLQRIGKRAPMHATGSGKVILSQYSPAKLEEFIAVKGLPRFTDYTITNPAELFAELDKVRETHIGMDEQECELGLRCISSPLFAYSGEIIASISVFGDVSLLGLERVQEEIIPSLQEITAIISGRLGYEPDVLI